MRALVLRHGPTLRRTILLALVFLLPIFFWRGANDQVNVPKLGLLMLVLSIVVGVRIVELLQGADRSSLSRLAIPALAFVAPLTVGWLLSPYKAWAVFGFYSRWQGLVPYVVIALFGVALADSFGGRARELAWALVTSASIVGAYALVQRLGLDPLDWVRPGGDPNEAVTTLGNPNFTGGFLGIVVPVAVGLFLTEVSRRALVAFLSLLVVGGLVASFSQGGWGAAIAGAAIVVGVWLLPRWRHSVKAAALVVAGVAVLAIGLVAVSAVAPGADFVPGTAFIRGEAWRAAAGLTADHPLVGRGPNAFAIEGVRYRTDFNGVRAGYNFPDDPHSVLLSLTASAGVFGAAGFLVFLWWVIKRARASAAPPLLEVAFLGAVVAYVIQSLVSIDEVALRTTLWTCLAGFVVASEQRETDVLAAMSKKERARARTEGLRRPLGVAAAVLAAVGGIWWSANFVVADARVWQGRLLSASGAAAEAAEQFDKARGFRDDYQYRVVEAQELARVAVASQEPERDDFEAALRGFGFLDGFPHVLYLLEQAQSLDLGTVLDQSFDEEALQVYERMGTIDPVNPMIDAGAADALIELGRAGEAVDRLEPFADDVDPIRRPQFFAVLALAYAAEGDLSSARETLALLDEDGTALPHAERARQLIEGEG